MPKTDVCSSPKCGRPIIWAVTPDGARIPLDARPVVIYMLDESVSPPMARPVEVEAVLETAPNFFNDEPRKVKAKTYVSHYLTCLDVGSFNRRPVSG